MAERDPDAADVRRFWQRLDLPGIFDVHAHFLPEPVQRKVFAQFDQAGPKIGRDWPIRYRGSYAERLRQLDDFGVRHFPTLPYAHRPEIAGYLNDWSAQFAAQTPGCLWSATFYPEESASRYVPELIERGVRIFKIHLQVGEFLADDPLLDPVWAALERAGTPIVVHAGSGPVANDYTGPASLGRVLAAYPRLRVIVAHLGAPEYADFLALAERYDEVRLDTTMVFTDFFDADGVFPPALVPRLRDLGERVLFGSDFPTIPYPYATGLHGLERLGLGEDWLRGVCWGNAAALFEVK